MAKVAIGAAPLTVNHESQYPEVTISYNLKPGVIQADANEAVLAAIAEARTSGDGKWRSAVAWCSDRTATIAPRSSAQAAMSMAAV